MPYKPLTRERLTAALKRLAELAQVEGLELELSLYGGAVFTLVYGSRESTKDVDAIIQPARRAAPLVRKVAGEQGLPEDWLNGYVGQFLSANEEKRPWANDAFTPGLSIKVPTAAYLLALKLKAARAPLPGYPGDEADIRFLLKRLRLTSVEAVEVIHEKFFPNDTLTPRARAVLSDYLSADE